MRRTRVIFVLGIALILVGGLMATGLGRLPWAMAPKAAGLTEVSTGVWIDQADRAPEALTAISDGQALIAPFWQETVTAPRMIICTTHPCAARFRLNTPGLYVGKSLVFIGPGGLNATIIGHELSHIALSQRMTFQDTFRPRFPTWFNEGLASHLAPDPRHIRPATPKDAAWITDLTTPRKWNQRVGPTTWPEAYGAAATLVGQLSNERLRTLIQDVAQGEDFSLAFARAAEG